MILLDSTFPSWFGINSVLLSASLLVIWTVAAVANLDFLSALCQSCVAPWFLWFTSLLIARCKICALRWEVLVSAGWLECGLPSF